MNSIFFKLFCLIFLQLLLGCKTSYLEHNEPYWSSNKYNLIALEEDEIKVVSYNIAKSKNIDSAIFEFQNKPELKNADLILLQEMDEQAVITISEALNLNYIYYPISHYPKGKRNAGNAILSTQHIENPQKILLPHHTFLGKGKRISCSAKIKLGEKTVAVHSVHLETIKLKRKKRVEQLQEVLLHLYNHDDKSDYCIIGGDFNTMYKKDFTLMNKVLEEHGFESNTLNIGKTGSVPLNILKPQLDHIYSKGFKQIDSGKCEDCIASDHIAVWTTLKGNVKIMD